MLKVERTYCVNQIGADHCASAAFASLAVHYCYVLRILAKPSCNLLAELCH